MKDKFSSFLVRRSKIILIIFIALAVGFAALIPFVNVNHDTTKYLPDDSSMKKGMDLMKAEFGKESSCNLKVMFNDLKTDKKKLYVLNDLASIKYVSNVNYDIDKKDYNRGIYTLYIINCDCDQYSDRGAYIWKTVQKKYSKKHDITLGGSINDANESDLPLWIVIIAVVITFIILLIMANSYIEPLAMMITIGIAILINMGSYVFFPYISHTTYLIAAVLQMVLSMDYSIMLLNRYRQQRIITSDKYQGMRASLSLSFGAITGSSLTTFAGLLALLFMSFKIGADIGLSLAKGVIISLICLFTVMPALLLAFDSLMTKTVKKSFAFDLPVLGRFQHRFRIPLTAIFAVLFIAVFITRGYIDFSYAQNEPTDIDRVFGYDNSMVLIYNAKDSASAEKLASELEDNTAVKNASCYESTLGKKRTAPSMKKFLKDMYEINSESHAGTYDSKGKNDDTNYKDINLDKDMLRMTYYDYFRKNETVMLTIPQFVTFMENDVFHNDTFSGRITKDKKSQINKLSKYIDKKTLTTAMNDSSLAAFFEMNSSQVKQILLYYQMKHGDVSGGTMSLPAFVDFLIHDVATDSTYGRMIDRQASKNLKAMRPYTNIAKMTNPVTYSSSSKTLGIASSKMKMIYVQYFKKNMGKKRSSIGGLADSMKAVDPGQTQLIAALTQLGQYDTSSYTVKQMKQVLSANGIPIDASTLSFIYSYQQISASPGSYKISIQNLVGYMLSGKDISSALSKKQLKQLKTLHAVINASVNRTRFSASSMAEFLGMGKKDVRNIYLLNLYKQRGTNAWRLSPQRFINFIASDVLNDSSLNSNIGTSKKDIAMIQTVINSSISDRRYTAAGISNLFNGYAKSSKDGISHSNNDDFDTDSMLLLYKYYGSKHMYNDKWKMDLISLVHHADDKTIKSSVYSKVIDKTAKSDIKKMRKDLDDAAEKLSGRHYGRMLINADVDEDSDKTRAFMSGLDKKCSEKFSNSYYLIGNTPMAYEMSKSFKNELNSITIITAIFIFIIVLFTFRRLATPVLLVLLIQCAVFMTMSIMNIINYDMNHLSLLIVQSIMMGATIDYAIIYSSYYIEARRNLPPLEAIREAYSGSLQTILTSAFILIVAIGVISFAFSQLATRQICRILSAGCAITTLLVIFMLPAILACFDRFIIKRSSKAEN